MVPNAPADAPNRPTVLFSNGMRPPPAPNPSATDCDNQSMVFFNSGVIDALYSGLAINSPRA